MYASVELVAGHAKAKTLAVPDSAVLDSGTRQIVLVERGEGRFEPRPVRLGARADGYVEVLEGVQAGEKVVVSANFLIDAESNLRAALGTFGAPAAGAAAQPDDIAIGKVHQARGTVRAVDLQGGRINIEHGPVASLNWPAMTMDFVPKDKALLKGLKPGQDVEFEIVQQGPAEFALSRITPRAGGPAQRAPAAGAGHAGH
jgi:Cu(I)/Ag(I) efflux system membrane fusion protein